MISIHPKFHSYTTRRRVLTLVLPAEQAAEGKQAQQQLAALVDGAEEAPHLVRFGVGVTAR
jgi:hypothetical protein